MKWKLSLAVLVVGVVGAGWYFWQNAKEPETRPTETVRRATVVETVSVTGELVPERYADLSFPLVGVVDSLRVREGDRVETGAEIASLDRETKWVELRRARVAASIVEADERLARRRWDDLKPEERLMKKLASEEAREAVALAKARLFESVLTAPFPGTIVRVDTRVGETVSVGKLIARLVEDEGLVIEARIPESDIAKIETGMRADVTFDALTAAEVYPTEVFAIDTMATTLQEVVSYVVKFRLLETDKRFREGMTANIDIITRQRENVLVVPFRALTREGSKTYAEVRRGDGRFERVEVNTGLEGDDGAVEIRSGLEEGAAVSIIGRQP